MDDQADGSPREGKADNGHFSDGYSVDGNTVDRNTVNGNSLNGRHVNASLVNGHSVNGHSVNGSSINRNVKKKDANLSTKIHVQAWNDIFTATTQSCAALAIVMASHSGSSEMHFTTLPDYEKSLSDSRQGCSAEDPVSDTSFYVNVDWDSDIQGFLHNIQDRLSDMPAQRIQHLSEGPGLPQMLAAHTLEAQAMNGSKWLQHHRKVLVVCSTQQDGVQLDFAVDPAAIDSTKIKHVCRQYEHVLRGICSSGSEAGKHHTSEFRVSNMQDLDVIWSWNAVVPERVDACVHGLFARVVRDRPDAFAVSAHDGELTYRELDSLSTQLAHRLGTFGAQDSIVPVHMEKSVWTPVAQLAVMKAGAASVVLDASQPLERLRALVHEVDSRLILTSVSNEAIAHQLADKPVVVVGKAGLDENHLSPAPSTLPFVSPSARLYVVFTSGSTGMPKGAIVSHSNFTSAISHQQKALGFQEAERVFDFASYAFDVAWSNLLHTITAGACLCIPSDEERKQDIPSALRKYRVDYAHLTPSVAWFAPEDLPESVKTLQFSGEELKASLVQAFHKKAIIINTYGPAECSVTSSMQRVEVVADRNPPIGHGLGTCTWIVSLDGTQLVPIGEVGELWIEGPIVGQGYLNDPKKTAAAFVENPPWLLTGGLNADQPGRRGRLYRTGDLVRYNRYDGSLSFVGRKDSQVKIRGQRVELAEVEYHLRNTLADELQESMQVIAEVVLPHGSTHPALVAVVSPQDDKNRSETAVLVRKAADEWDERLVQVVPAYMIPSAYIPVDNLPMTATGKTDRRRLREVVSAAFWDHAALDGGKERELPTSKLEQDMAQVWSEVLNVPVKKISVDTAFTRLGGDSITAMQVVSRFRARKIAVTVGDILRFHTIRALALRCKPILHTEAIVATAEADVEGQPWPVSPMQQLFFDAHPVGLNHYTQSFLLRLTRPTTNDALRVALAAVVKRHGMLRARFRRRNDTEAWEQFIAPADTSAIVVEEHASFADGSLQETVQARQAALDIQHGPVFAADLFSPEGEDQTLLLSAHHIVIDLVSWRVIWHDLAQCLAGGGPLPPAPVSFQTWCRVQRKEGRTLNPVQVLPNAIDMAHTDYWGLTPGDNRFVDSIFHEHTLDSESTALLLGPSNDSLHTEALDILIGALVHSFRIAFTDRNAPAVFLEGHGREPVAGIDIDLGETVGWFTTLHPVQVPGTTADSLVEAVMFAKDARARVPSKGRQYMACRYHSEAGREAFSHHGDVELLLNYRGVFQQLESSGALLRREDRPERSVAIREFGDGYQRMALVEINIIVEAGRTCISATTHRRMRHQDRLERWFRLFTDALRDAANNLLVEPPRPTLADLSLLSISHAGLDTLLTEELAARGVAPVDVRDIYPCTPVQEGIILSSKRGAASYHNCWVWRCSSSASSPISFNRLAAAWEAVTRRHSVFATIFATHPETGRYIQVLLRNTEPRCVRTRVTASQSATQYLLDMKAPSTISPRKPDYTITVCQGENQETACRLDMTHALIDASSIPVLLRDLVSIYDGGGGLMLGSPPFSDVVSHIQHSNGRVAYWQAHLAGAQPCKVLGDLPLHGRRTGGGYQYGLIPLPATTTAAIAPFCRNHNATRAVFLQVAWALVLAQFTGKTEACFGYVCSGRDTPVDGIEAVVGPLISMFVARIDLSAPHLESVLAAVSEQSIEHLSHQHTSLAEIQHAMGSGLLFNTAITVREAHCYGSKYGVFLEEIREDDPHEYDLLLSAVLDGDKTEISVQYRSDFMSTGLAQKITGGLESAITYLTGFPSTIQNCPPPASTADGSSKTLYQSYFKHITGTDEKDWASYWHGRFEGLQSAAFPLLPSASYQPQADTIAENMVHGLHWPEPYTPQTVIQAAWATVQASHANSDDVWFGVLFCEASLAPLQLASALPTRVTLKNEQKVAELLNCLHSESVGPGLSVQRVQLLSEEAVRACQFQTLLVIIDEAAERVHAGPQRSSYQQYIEDKPAGGTEKGLIPTRPLALTIQCFVDGSTIRLHANFDSKAVESEGVTRMLQQFECALKWLSTTAHLQRKVLDIDRTSDRDLRDIWGWNGTVPEPVDVLVHDLFTQVAQRQPEAPAVSAWDGELTYHAINDLSTRLALHLVQLGVGPGTLVPIYIEKSLWTPVAQLAVMMAGGASVLLDSTQPVERARAIVSQTKLEVVISSPAMQEAAFSLGAPDLIVLDWSFLDSIQHAVRGWFLPRTSVPSDLLYVVFTSGSTGVPKGAMITHGNFAAAIRYQQLALGYTGPGNRVYDFVSYAFDVAWSNTLHTLTSGACLCIPSDGQRKDDIVSSMQVSEVTMVDLTPSILRLLKPQHLPRLRHVILSGESFTKADLGDWVGHTRLLNTYGPAECSVKATMALVNPVSTSENDIGCGEGLVTWVVSVDNPDKLAPVGSVGELWLEGPLVGKGYLGDQIKTAAAFIRDPQWLLRGGPGCPGRRGLLYRTGDLVRYDCSSGGRGILHFVGRKDSQIKIRGQRVELGEIESHVKNSLAEETDEQVQVVAEVMQPRDSTNFTLVAFLCAARATKANVQKLTAGLEDRLKDRLPAYMIPSAYLPVDRIPVGATGKTDRRQLREMGASMTLQQLADMHPLRSSTSGRRRAESPTEALLLEAWAVILDTDASHFSPDDSFLRVGGDSIGAMRLVGVARERGISLSVADVFRWPRLADLARELDGRSLAAAPAHKTVAVKPFSLLGQGLVEDEIRAQAASLCIVDAAQVVDVFPCTPLQEGLLAMTMRRPGDYVLRQARPLSKHVDVQRFRQAWEQVVRATPILRTRIVHLRGRGLLQVVTEQANVQWRFGSDVEKAVRELVEMPVGLGTPLARFALVEDSSDGQAYFVSSLHHALFDGWSLALIEEALLEAYQGHPLREAVSMQTFVRYIRQQSDEDLKAFWRGQLLGTEAQPFLNLPSANFQPRSNHVLQSAVDDLDWGSSDYTASTAVKAAWAVLLSAYTSSSDAVFGVTVSGRQAAVPGIEHVAGPTIATVPLRVAVDRDASVEHLLRQVQLQGVEMVPFEQAGLQRIQQMGTDCEQACRFQTLLIVQPEPRAKTDGQPKLFQQHHARDEYDDFAAFNTYPVLLECQLQQRGMQLRISIDSNVISVSAGQRMADQFAAVLRQVCSRNRRSEPVSSIQTASAQDLRNIWSWNPPSKRVVSCVHDIFTEVTLRQPDAPAICAWNGELSYQELDGLSTRLAQSLVAESPGADLTGTIVPLYFEKSLWMPVAQLGVMKAGAASVALDANLPLERLRSIFQQVAPRVILSSAANEKLAKQLTQSVRVVDERLKHFHPTAAPELPSINPSSPVYVVFTSGSTGTPKGAMVSHTNFASAITYQQRSLELSRQSRVYDFVSYAFDVSWSNVLQTLCAGGCLCIPSEAERKNNPADAMRRMHVNYAHLTPTVARLLQGLRLPGLEIISFIGEPLRAADVTYWKNSGVRVINTYGPAECTPVATVQVVELDVPGDPSVGRGVGAQTWVVDIGGREPKLAAIGTVGELWLEGPLVGLGYLNNAEKTTLAFVEDPPWLLRGGGPGFPGRKGRLYRTGDLVRYDSDGTLSFVGRKDSQVKIHGQRVELGEIEHHVRDAFSPLPLAQVVAEVIIPADSNDPVLAAFLQIENSADVSVAGAGALLQNSIERAHSRLLQSVPSYMIPAAYVPVQNMPMTASGKMDRLTLRSHGAALTKQELTSACTPRRQMRAPKTQNEAKVHGLVARLLCIGLAELSMDDNFIRIGGDSIKAIQLISMAREEALALTVADILIARNLGELAKKCTTFVAAAVGSVEPFSTLGFGEQGNTFFVEQNVLPQLQFKDAKVSNVWPASSAQSAYLEDALRMPRRSWYQFYVDFLPCIDRKRLAKSCLQMLNRHDIFRSVFVSVHGRFYQAVLEIVAFPIEQMEILTESIDDVFEKDRDEELQRPATLGTLFVRVKLLHKHGVGTRLVLSMSHALYDGITLDHIARDLSAFYRGERLMAAPSFSGYMEHLVSRAAADRDYWRNLLRGSSVTVGAPDLPVTTTPNGSPIVLERTVRAPTAPPGVTSATLFTAACAITLARVTSPAHDIVFGRVISTRATLPDALQDVVGPCINTVPVRISASALHSGGRDDVLAAVQRQYIDGMPHEMASPERSEDFGGFDFALSSASRGCVTQFQNIHDRPALPSMPTAPGSVLDARSDAHVPVNPAFLWIYGTPRPDLGVVRLSVTAGSAFSKGRIQWILDELCNTFVR